MKFPRSVSGEDVVRALVQLSFTELRQSGSHVRLGRDSLRVTVPLHKAVATGTLKSILRQARVKPEELAARLR